MSPATATVISVLGVSLLALLGVLALMVDAVVLKRILRPIIAASIGVLVGEAVLHLIPDSLGKTHSWTATLDLVGVGIVAFAAMEFALRRWVLREGKVAPVGLISAIAEGVHNAMDGALIASCYFLDMRAGVLATVAVACHEVPHELGNVAVLLHAGYSPKRAVGINLLSASAALLGAFAMLGLGERVRGVAADAGPIAAGGFLYLAIGILAPDLWRTSSRGQMSIQGLGAACGFALTAAVAWFR